MRAFIMALLVGASLFTQSAKAAKVSIALDPMDLNSAPAEDLVLDGKRIDSSQALQLKQNGEDISLLAPHESKLFIGKRLELSNQRALAYPQNEILNFRDYKTSPTEIFRARVSSENGDFTLTAGLDNHMNILRAAILRGIGYDLDVPKYYSSLKISFDTKEEASDFLSKIGEQTLTNRERWTATKISDTLIEFKGLTLEPATLRNVNIYLPVMSRSRQESRRVFRALLSLYVLTDFPQKANSAAWTRGREFNGSLIFNHPYASAFSNVTIDDFKWSLRKLNELSKEDFAEALSYTGIPEDIAALYTEKLVSRLNHLNKLARLEAAPYSVDMSITTGDIVNGKLTKEPEAGLAVQFYQEDELSPYRFRELFRLFRTQLTYNALSSLLDKGIEKFVPGLRIKDAAEDIQEQISDFRSNSPQNQGALPIKAFTKPIANGRVFSSRNVVFGQYLGSDAPIQLVDTAGAEVNLGAFSNITGLSQKSLPSVSATAALGRTYTHVRAMPDLKTASRQHIKKLLVPRHFKSLGKVIKAEYICSIPSAPYVEESSFGGEKIFYVKYDPSWENGKGLAIQKRQELIDSGVTESVLLVKIDRSELCASEVETNKKESLKEFIKQFALNEMFIVTDTLRLTAGASAPIPLLPVAGAAVSLNISGDTSVSLLRSTMIRKTEEGLELSVQAQRDKKGSLSEGLSFFLELASNTTAWTKGKLISKVYKVKLEGLDNEDTSKVLSILRSLFVDNNRGPLEENYSPVDLDHDVSSRLNTLRLLFFKNENLKMDHEVEIIVPNRPGQNFSVKQRTKKLYSVGNYKRSGVDFYGFINRALTSVSGFLGLGGVSNDPGKNLFGSSKKSYFLTEADITEGQESSPLTRVEYAWSGWSKRPKKLFKVFDKVKEIYGDLLTGPLLEPSLLQGVTRLKSYDVKTSIIVYPDGAQKLKDAIFKVSELSALNYLRFLYGTEEWEEYCKGAFEFFGETGPHIYRLEDGRRVCAPSSVSDLIDLRKKSPPSGPIEVAKQENKIIRNLFKNFKTSRVLGFIGETAFFSTTRVTGYREGHPDGMLEHISNSIGTYNRNYGTGIFDSVAQAAGISAFELRAMMYTPTM